MKSFCMAVLSIPLIQVGQLSVTCEILVNSLGGKMGPPAGKRDLTTICNILSNTHLKSDKNYNFFYCHSKRVQSCMMHSSISYLLNLQLL